MRMKEKEGVGYGSPNKPKRYIKSKYRNFWFTFPVRALTFRRMFWRSPHFAAKRLSVNQRNAAAHKEPERKRVSRRHKAGFSLVEVVLAVGITSFILITVFGMTAMAVKTTQEADINARVAAIDRTTAALFQMEHFNKATTALPATYSYDIWGSPIQDGYYRCDVKNVTPPGASTNLLILQVQVRWPSPQLKSTNTSIISVGNYD